MIISPCSGDDWVTDANNTVVDAKGDILVGTSADTLGRLAAGTDGQILSTDSTQTTGLQWVSSGNLLTLNVATGTDTLATTAEFTASYATLASSTDEAKYGLRSLKLTSTGTSTPTAYTPTISIKPSTVYTVSYWIKSAATTKNNAPMLYWSDASTTTGITFTLSNTWTKITMIVTSPAAANTVYLRTSANVATFSGTETIYLDGFTIHEGIGGRWVEPGRNVPDLGAVYGTGSPEAIVYAPIGAVYIDESTGNVWVKNVGTTATGWVLQTRGASTTVDNTAARYDGTSGKLQGSGIIIDDSNNVTIPGTLTVSGGTTVGTGSITGSMIANDTITATQIAANAVTASELADNAVDTNAIADLAVTAGKIANDTITATQIAANAIGASELADNAVDTNAIADSAVTSGKIADGTIVDGDISATAAISQSKVANLTTDLAGKQPINAGLSNALAQPDTETERLLKSAVFWIDAAHSTAGSQTIQNLGYGGSVLNAQSGSTVNADTNDPTYLSYTGTPYVYLPGVAGNYLSVPDEAALDITGDIDIRVRVALDDWTPAAITGLVSKWNTSNLKTFAFDVNTNGTLALYLSPDGTAQTVTNSTVAVPFSDGTAGWVRVAVDVDNGAGGWSATFFTSTDGASWSQLGNVVTTAGTTSIAANNQALAIGSGVYAGNSNMLSGRVYRVQVLNGIDGTTVLDIDCDAITSGSATSFTATTGQTVTINRSTTGKKAAVVCQPVWLFGTDDYLQVTDNDMLDFGANDSFSLVAVVRQNATPTSSGRYIDKRGSSGAGYLLAPYSTNYYTYPYIEDNLGNNTGSPTSTSSSKIVAGDLGIVTYVINRSNQKLTTYWNTTGDQQASISAIGSLQNSKTLNIGSSSTGSATQDFELYGVAIFRKALSATEIAKIVDYYQGRERKDQTVPGNIVVAGTINGHDITKKAPVSTDIAASIAPMPNPAEQLLKQSVFWIDAGHSSAGNQTISNLGWGGSSLDAKCGSTYGIDSNDPKYLGFDGTPYVYLPGSANNYTSVPDEAALDITGDIDIRVKMTAESWIATQFLFKSSGAPNRSWDFYSSSPSGYFIFQWSADGTNWIIKSSTVPCNLLNNSTKWVRATLDVDNGASGNTVTFYVSDDGQSWTRLGDPVITAGTTSIYSGSANVSTSGGTYSTAGKIYKAQVLNGIDGRTVLDIDTSVITSGSQTSFNALTGQTVTINRSTSGRKAAAVCHPLWLFGTDDYIVVPDNDLIDFGASDSFSLILIGRQWGTVGTSTRYMDKRSTVGYLLASNSNQTIMPYLNDGTNAVDGSSTGYIATGPILCVAMIVDRSLQRISHYVNNNYGGSSSISSVGSLASVQNLHIGSSSVGTLFQDFECFAAAVFRRPLLQDEIQTIMDYYIARTRS